MNAVINATVMKPMALDGLREWVAQWATPVKAIGGTIIGVIAVFIITVLIIKAVSAGKKQQSKEMVKPIAFAIAVALLAALGVGGLFKLVDATGIKQDSGIEFSNTEVGGE